MLVFKVAREQIWPDSFWQQNPWVCLLNLQNNDLCSQEQSAEEECRFVWLQEEQVFISEQKVEGDVDYVG